MKIIKSMVLYVIPFTMYSAIYVSHYTIQYSTGYDLGRLASSVLHFSYFIVRFDSFEDINSANYTALTSE
jgi:hypothetical protein